MIQLVFATNNKHKLHEIVEITKKNYLIKSLAELNIFEEIPETKNTLEGNAIEKAMFIYNKYGYSCFADDTGLEVDALDGRPGVFSARYAGEGCSFEDNLNKLLFEMREKTNRKASFRTVIAFVDKGQTYTFEGEVSGVLTTEKRGEMGFGYDPIFLPDGYNATFAEMSMELKNKISHRADALKKFAAFLKRNF